MEFEYTHTPAHTHSLHRYWWKDVKYKKRKIYFYSLYLWDIVYSTCYPPNCVQTMSRSLNFCSACKHGRKYPVWTSRCSVLKFMLCSCFIWQQRNVSHMMFVACGIVFSIFLLPVTVVQFVLVPQEFQLCCSHHEVSMLFEQPWGI